MRGCYPAMAQSRILTVAELAGIGLVSGLAGSLFMALSQRAEMALTGREPSTIPADAIEAVSGVDVPEGEPKHQVSTAGHLAFGTSLGLGLVVLSPLPEPARGLAFFAAAWTAGTTLITRLGLSDPPTRWDAKQLGIDLAHHAVYAATAAATFVGLRRLAQPLMRA